MTSILSRLEGLIYVTGDQGVTKHQLMKQLALSEQALQKLIHSLQVKYEQDNDCAFQILAFNDHYRMATKRELDADINAMLEDDPGALLTPAALETVTIIAYNQPVTRVEVDDIRGVNSSSIIQKLLKQSLIKTQGRKKVPGEPYLYVTTDQFLNLFGLKQLSDLPPIDKNESEEFNE